MKRTVALILCLILLVCTLASCQTEIGEYLKEYDYEEEIIQNVAINLYVPCTTDTTENAKISVSNRIVALGESDFIAQINVIYVPADDAAAYRAAVVPAVLAHKAAADAENAKYTTVSNSIASISAEIDTMKIKGEKDETIEAKKAELAAEKKKISYTATADLGEEKVKYSVDLVLVNSADMFNDLYDGGVLNNLSSYMSSTAYGKLNTQITNTLLAASKKDNKFFCVPNNHVISNGYTYLVIDKAIARDELHYSPAELAALKSIDEAKDLICKDYYTLEEGVAVPNDAKVTALLGSGYPTDEEPLRAAILTAVGFDSIFSVETVRNRYEDKAAIEAEGKYCNVISYPAVNAEEAYSSAFAVANAVAGTSADRAMQIIYSLNTDPEFHNLLLYGMKSSNYNVTDSEAKRFNATETDATTSAISIDGITDVYKLASDEKVASTYCGDQFLSYYIGSWNENAAENGAKHNAESVVAGRD